MSVRLPILIALALVLGLLMVSLSLAEEGPDPRREGFRGTYTHVPAVPGTPNLPPSASGVVVIYPHPRSEVIDPYLDWRTLRKQRLLRLAQEIAQRIHFDFDDAHLDDRAREAVSEISLLLAANPDVGVLVQGHTDLVGTEEYNQALSERRAKNIRQALEAAGVSPSQLGPTSGVGEAHPLLLTLKAERMNRRVTVYMTDLFRSTP